MQDSFADEVKPFKAFHYNGLGIREEDGTKKVSDNVILNIIIIVVIIIKSDKVAIIILWPLLSQDIQSSHFGVLKL